MKKKYKLTKLDPETKKYGEVDTFKKIPALHRYIGEHKISDITLGSLRYHLQNAMWVRFAGRVHEGKWIWTHHILVLTDDGSAD